MFPRRQRLDRTQFDAVKVHGSTIRGTYATLKIAKSDKSSFAVVVSKKVTGSAVRRHLIRRRMYALLRETLPTLSDSWSAIVFVGPKTSELSKEEWKSELHDLFQRAGALKSH